eukprot:COSAG02_NODE_68241_length_251_cov_0.664474_2_plen_27_part_01
MNAVCQASPELPVKLGGPTVAIAVTQC